MRHAIRTLALSTLFAAALPMAAQAGPKDRPFTATVSTQEALSNDSARCPIPQTNYLTGKSTGSGVATHMGKVSLVSSDCPAPLAADLSQWAFQGGALQLMAANGDMVYANYQGGLAFDPTSGLFALNGTYAITGGTGRFVGASGSGTLSGTASLDLATGTSRAQYTATGTIRY